MEQARKQLRRADKRLWRDLAAGHLLSPAQAKLQQTVYELWQRSQGTHKPIEADGGMLPDLFGVPGVPGDQG